ncbi:tyrosine/phenylalanine carboxypeptidase domain-containing protein [Altibacter sp.]|uniref:flavohemoglobin expression-modulating QEGLA motif protein n=1 Tax=Altibacter sp. TaxID=2024823 RepID=UPI00258DAEE0|nr:tyrosine/phenylalanine carboxypeptidase domain-containing protein [Altibacter sp.]MCW8981259.1 flavohemoglobin expression-modulating QEGLA motif protein [Altibacter sp.]MCW9038470.1 flavohemoglobin expression-modulating QEGLA motif protein [Altibacter sp.]
MTYPSVLTEAHPNLFRIDQQLNKLVQKIELLNYVNPINIEQEKRNFFASKYNINPNFKYRKIDFDAHKLQQALFSQDIDSIRDPDTQKFYRDVIYDYSGLVQCIETIGRGRKFYYNALKSFGTPTQKDVENAQFILHFQDEEYNQEMFPVFSADEATEYFLEFSKKYDFEVSIKHSTKITAAAMVQNNTQRMLLKKNHRFSANQLKVLANHEIGVHLVTTFNGMKQALKIFHNGFPNNVETQEGLAVFSEYMSDCLTLYRLKELSYRVLAADSLHKGFNFCDTFDLLHNQYKLNREEAYNISLRAHRGGGFTKDYKYLTGLKKVYDHYKTGGDLSLMLTGKVSLKHEQTIQKWQQEGLAQKITYKNEAFLSNTNSNNTIDFILQNLK